MIGASAVCVGIVEGLLRHAPNPIATVFGGIAVIATLVWIRADAIERGRRIAIWFQLLVLVIPPIGFLLYCLCYGRFKAMGLGLLVFLGFCMIVGITSEVASEFVR